MQRAIEGRAPTEEVCRGLSTWALRRSALDHQALGMHAGVLVAGFGTLDVQATGRGLAATGRWPCLMAQLSAQLRA